MNEEIKHGDIFISASGFQSSGREQRTTYSMFEYDALLDKGDGRIYNPVGEPMSYKWAYPKVENRFDNVPEDILFSFQHGTWRFSAPESVSPDDGLENLIRNSDFKFVTKEYVDLSKEMVSVETVEDVRNLWPMLKKHNLANVGIASICLEAMGLEILPPRNGEIGIHSMMILATFTDNVEAIEKQLNFPSGEAV